VLSGLTVNKLTPLVETLNATAADKDVYGLRRKVRWRPTAAAAAAASAAADYCYLCAYKLGWSGKDGRQACDHRMLSNFLTACEASFPVRNRWDWKGKWHKFWCDSTAGVMFSAVWAWQELKGGVLHTYSECGGDVSSALGAADFCFYQ
jgi:hypothetical protein